MGVLYSPTNVVVGLAVGYYAPVGTEAPDDDVAFAGTWGTDWVQCGATEEGFRLTSDQSTTPHRIEEQANPVLNTLDNLALAVAAALAEDTLESMRLAFGGGVVTTEVGTPPAPTVKTLTLAETVNEFAFGLDMETYPVTVGGTQKKVTRRIVIPRMSGSGAVDVAFRRAAGKRLWPISMTQLCKPSEVIIKDIIPTA